MRREPFEPPPAAALAWVAESARGRVLEVERLPGGIASSVHGIAVARPNGERRELVLRRFTRRDWVEPGLAAREATALLAVAGIQIPTPELVAVDETGASTGVPAVLMTRLAGRPLLAPSDLDAWLRSLAALLPLLHGSTTARTGLVREYAPYTAAADFSVPAWAKRPECWERALEILGGELPLAPRVAIHRDFHPANVLFEGRAISGLVDWTQACLGPGGIDVAHCRLNLAALYGPAAADDFSQAWRAEAGADHDPRWDLVCCLDVGWEGFAGWDQLGARTAPLAAQRESVEEHVGRCVARC